MTDTPPNPPHPPLGKDDLPALALFALCIAGAFYPALFGEAVFLSRDIPFAAYPWQRTLWEALHQGTFPYWNPAVLGGVPFMAQIANGAFYPPHLIFLLKDFSTAFNWSIVLHHLWLACGVYLLARRWRMSLPAAFLCGLTALWGGYFLSLIDVHNHFRSTAWTPWVWLAFSAFAASGKARHFAAGVACVAMQILAGGVEPVLMTAVLLLAGALFWPREEGPDASAKRRAAVVVSGLVLAGGLCAAQLLPTAELTQESVRTAGLSFEEHAHYSMSPRAVLTTIYQDKCEGLGDCWAGDGFIANPYMGLVPILFLAFAALRARDSRLRFWAVAFFAGLFLALGKHNPVYEILYRFVPFLDHFRYPQKFFFFCAFALVFLAGFGLDALAERPRFGRMHGFVFGLFVFSVASAGWGRPAVWVSLGCALTLGGALALRALHRIPAHNFKALILVVAMADLAWRHFAMAGFTDRVFFEAQPLALKDIAPQAQPFRIYSGELAGPVDFYKFPDAPHLYLRLLLVREWLRPNLGATHGLQYADGLFGIETRDHFRWRDMFRRSPEPIRAAMLKRANVRYWVRPPQISPEARFENIMVPQVTEWEDALPRAFRVPKARQIPPEKIAEAYYAPDFDPLAEVLLEDAPEGATEGREPGSAEIVQSSFNRVTVRVSPGGGFLVLLDAFLPGWQASIGGSPVPILRADGFYRAVPVPPGPCEVEFTYHPPGLRTGAAVSGLALLCFIGGVILIGRRHPGDAS